MQDGADGAPEHCRPDETGPSPTENDEVRLHLRRDLESDIARSAVGDGRRRALASDASPDHFTKPMRAGVIELALDLGSRLGLIGRRGM